MIGSVRRLFSTKSFQDNTVIPADCRTYSTLDKRFDAISADGYIRYSQSSWKQLYVKSIHSFLEPADGYHQNDGGNVLGRVTDDPWRCE
jgi:hypothetical protein